MQTIALRRIGRFLTLCTLFVIFTGSLFLLSSCKTEPPTEPHPTTIGEQVDFNVDRIVSKGALCRTAVGTSYTRISTNVEEIQWFSDLLANVAIVPDPDPEEVIGHFLTLDMGETNHISIRNENRLSINGTRYCTVLPMTAELEQLKELYSELPTLEYPISPAE